MRILKTAKNKKHLGFKPLTTNLLKGRETMKKYAVVMLALFGASMIASAAHAQFDAGDKQAGTKLDLSITFEQANGGVASIAIYNAKTGGAPLTSKTIANGGTALANEQRLVFRSYLDIKPTGLFDVVVYTNNLDKDNDGAIDNTAPYEKPANWNQMTRVARANWVGGYAGLPHSAFPIFVLPIKVWSLVTAGPVNRDEFYKNYNDPLYKPVVETIAPPITGVDGSGNPIPGAELTQIQYYDNDSDKWAWFGNTLDGGKKNENDLDYYSGSYGYVPEKLAVGFTAAQSADPAYLSAKADPDFGTYSKPVAGTLYATDVTSRVEVAYGTDLRAAGSGQYKGTIYLDLRGN